MSQRNPFTRFDVEPLPEDAAHYRAAFDSRFLRVYDLNERPKVVTITDVNLLKSSDAKGKETKQQLLVTLREFQKPWTINVTNADTIGALYGVNPRGWVGKQVELYPTKTNFGREVVDCIRVRDRVPESRSRERQAPREQPAQQRSTAVTRPEVAAYFERMALAQSADELRAVEDSIVDDNSLSAEETARLEKGLAKRRSQLESAPATAAQ